MFMWSPFDHDVTAMGWYDGSCTPSVVQPIIAIASSSGVVAIYDIRQRDFQGKVKIKGETIKKIVWNPFYRSRFYLGTQSGRLICCQIVKNTQETNKENVIVIHSDLKFNFSIDFISIDPQTGTTIAVGSKTEGKFSVINNIMTASNNDQFESYLLPEKNSGITSLSFFPGQVEFLIISTLNKVVLFSIIQKITVPIMEAEDIRFVSMQPQSKNGIVIGSSNNVALWKFTSNNSNDDKLNYYWNKVSQINFNVISSSIPECSMYANLEDKVVIINHSNWISEIQERRNRLFITQRSRLMPAKPLDWDFRKGSIAFCTSAGQVLVTSWTPDSIIHGTANENNFNSENSSQNDISGSSQTIENENDEKKKQQKIKFAKSIIKEQKYRRKQILGHNYKKSNSTDSTDDEAATIDKEVGKQEEETNISLSNDSNADSSSRPTFSMLMNQGDNDDEEFDIDSDNFEKRDSLDFSTNFVSMQASHVRNNFVGNKIPNIIQRQKGVKLTNFGSSDSMGGISTASLLAINDNDNESLNKSVTNRRKSFSKKNFDNSLKLPQEVSLDGDQQHEYFSQISDVANVGSYAQSSIDLEKDNDNINSANSNENNLLLSQMQHVECGNSSKLLLSFQVADHPLNHLMWAPGGRLIVWSFYNEKNILQLVDFKRRIVTPLLKVQLNAIHVPITNLFFSKDRSMFCVLIGNQTAVFMTTTANPTQIGTLNFKHHVIGSFDPTGKKAVFIRKDGVIYYASINYNEQVIVVTSKCKNKYLREKIGEPTYIIWRTIGILIGTSTGNVMLLKGDKYSECKQITKIENSKILYISPVTNESFLIMDDKQCAYLTTETIKGTELKCLKKNIKNIKSASENSFLCRVAGYGRLTVLTSNGIFSPLAPPCVSRCPLMLEEDQYMSQLVQLKLKTPEDAIKACRLFGAIFIMRLIKSTINKFELRNQTNLLFRILSNCTDFSSVAFKLALMIGERDTAKNMLLQTSPNDHNYVNNMNRASLFDLKGMGESTTLVLQNFFANNKIREAIDLLLIIGEVFYVINKYLDFQMPRDAAMFLRTNKVDPQLAYKQRKVSFDVATNLISNKHLLLGLMVLMENDYHDQVSKIVSGIFGDEMTHLLSFLKVSSSKKH